MNSPTLPPLIAMISCENSGDVISKDIYGCKKGSVSCTHPISLLWKMVDGFVFFENIVLKTARFAKSKFFKNIHRAKLQIFLIGMNSNF